MTQIITGRDAEVAAWLFETTGAFPIHLDMAIGLADETGALVGAVAFSGWNSSSVEVHIHGPGRLTRRIVRLIMGITILHFNANRLTVITRKDSMARGVAKLGAVYEGTLKRLYGPTDSAEHAGQMFAFYRETIEKLSGLKRTTNVLIAEAA